jgi:hypothetical protein
LCERVAGTVFIELIKNVCLAGRTVVTFLIKIVKMQKEAYSIGGT